MKDDRMIMIREFLENAHSRFPNMDFRCEYNHVSSTYVVEVKPLREFETNDDYAELEYDFTAEFEAKFPKYLITFVSENSMTKVGNSDFEICSFENEMSNTVKFTELNLDNSWYIENDLYMIAA